MPYLFDGRFWWWIGHITTAQQGKSLPLRLFCIDRRWRHLFFKMMFAPPATGRTTEWTIHRLCSIGFETVIQAILILVNEEHALWSPVGRYTCPPHRSSSMVSAVRSIHRIELGKKSGNGRAWCSWDTWPPQSNQAYQIDQLCRLRCVRDYLLVNRIGQSCAVRKSGHINE